MLQSIAHSILGLKKQKHCFANLQEQLSDISTNAGLKVLFWDTGGFHSIFERNLLLLTALKARGHDCQIILEDGTASASMSRSVQENLPLNQWASTEKSVAKKIFNLAKLYKQDFSTSRIFISAKELMDIDLIARNVPKDRILDYKYEGINVGQIAASSAIRYYKGFIIELNDLLKYEEVLRKFFYASLVNTRVAANALESIQPDTVITSHGVYCDYAPITKIAKKKKKTIVCWCSGHEKGHYFFTIPKGIEKLQLRRITNNSWNKIKKAPLTKNQKNKLFAYLEKRYADDSTAIDMPHAPLKNFNLKSDKPRACIFTHISWDSSTDMASTVFSNSNEWLIKTIDHMVKNDQVSWYIRVHPGEITDGSQYPASQLIKEKYPILPDHIKVWWHDDNINTWDILQTIDVGITIFGTIGMELTSLGKNVITAGEGHYGNKGFTIDSKSEAEYYNNLNKIPKLKPLINEKIILAQKYAHSYFLERQVNLDFFGTDSHWNTFDCNKLKNIFPGKDKILDKVCTSIVNNKDVILST